MDIKQLQAQIEAILFAFGEPIEVSKIAVCLELDEETVVQIIDGLSAQLEERNSGLCVLKLGNKYQLCTRTEYADGIRKTMETKKNAPLSNAAFEVLAIIAYNQPVTKSFVEQIRGVDCSGVINSLCQKSLIEEKGRLDLPGRPLLYGTTPEFLRCFCVSSLEELPSLPGKDEQMSMEEAIREQNAENAENSDNTDEDFKQKVDENLILM